MGNKCQCGTKKCHTDSVGDMSEISYDNFEGFGGDYARQHRDSIDLVNEIEELRYSGRKLQDENDRLSSQIAHADDAYQAIVQENKILKKKIESMQVLIMNVKDMEREYDDMKESLNSTKAENDDLKASISESERERLLYQGKAENLEKKLQLMEEDIAYFRLEEKKLLCVVENQEKSLIKAESRKTQLQEDLILKEEKCKEMENIMNQYREVLENLRTEKTALEHNLLNSQKNNASQIVPRDADDSDDTISITGEYELFENWQSEICSEKIEEWSYRNLKDELQEVIEKEAKSSYLNRLLNLQNIFKTIYASLKENVLALSRVNSQAASILELENVKENKEKEDPKALLEREPAKDSFDESIQEQINAELKALRAQIARSQAVLAFLQTKGSSLPQGIEKHSIKWPPQPLEISEGVDIPGNLELYMGYLHREQGLSEQPERPRFVRHRNPPNRSNSSTASQKAVPLHRSPLALSCPILPSQTSFVTRATQTEPVNSTIITLRQTHDKKIESAASLNHDTDLTETRAISTHNVTSANIPSPCEVNSAIKGIRTCLLAVPNAYQFQESADSPISPSFPRNRSFSFVTAIRKGNPHLVDANDNCHHFSTEVADSYMKDNQTIVFDTTSVKVPDTPPPITTSSENTMKDFRPYIYPSPSEDIECNRYSTGIRNSSSCPSRSLHAMHSVPPYSKAVESMKFQTDSRQGKRINEICAPVGDYKEENQFDSENKSKDETKNTTDKDVKMYKHTKRRLSGSGQSHNSSPGIVRCPAFDFSEQDDDVATTASLQVTGNIKRRDNTNKCKVPMPDLKENSETESAKGSANGSFEYEAGEALLSSNQIEITTGTDPAFPSLPDSFLKRLGVHKNTPISVESLTDEEIEAKFNTLSLAFKTDKYTLAKRMELHQRQRDITEKNIESELNALKELVTDLGQHYSEGEQKELVCKIQNHVDIIEQSTSRISSRAEIFGSVQQEERLSQAVEIMVNHVENIKRLYKKEHQELEDMRNLWNEGKIFDDNSGDSAGEEGKRSLRSLIMASAASKQETTDNVCSPHSMIAKNSSCWSRNSESFSCTNTYNLPAFGHFSFTSVSRKWSALSCPTIGTACPPVIKIATAHSALEAFVGSSENSSDIQLLPNECENSQTVCQSIDESPNHKLNEKYTNGNDAKGDASFHYSKNDRWNSSRKISEHKLNQVLHRRWMPFIRFPVMGFLICLSILTVIMWILVSFISASNVSCFKDSVINWSWLDIFKRIFDHLIVMKYNNVPPT